MHLPPTPILADWFGTLIAVGFLVVSFVGWLVNIINGAQKPPPRVQRPIPQRRSKLRDELDRFIEQQRRQQLRGRTDDDDDDDVIDADDVEVVAPARRGPAPSRPPPRRPIPPRSAPGSRPPSVPRQPDRPRLHGGAQAPLTTKTPAILSPLGPSLGESTTGTAVQGAPPRPLVQERSAPPLPGARRTRTPLAESVLGMLSNPKDVRSAIILSEILNRPQCTRRD